MSDAKLTTYQFITERLDASVDWDTLTMAAPMTAVVPQGADRRERQRNAKTMTEWRALQRFNAVVIPAGTKLVPSVGDNGDELAGPTAFYAVPEGEAIELVYGTSAEIKAAFEAFLASNG